jgi:tRNA(fMet)-specific endonuclease VapC
MSTPMNGRFLLDTNLVILIFAQDATVESRLAQSTDVFVPSVVLGELYYGAYKSSRATENIAKTFEFAERSAVIGCDATTAQRYGEIKNVLRAKGRPIPENDIWIAAIAYQHDLTLVTRDAHFTEVEGLSLDAWA